MFILWRDSMLFWKKRVGGEIAYYRLTEWWLNSLTENDRHIIRKTYRPMMIDRALDEGNITFSSQSVLAFLGVLAEWFKKADLYEIGKKILTEGEKHYDSNKNILDQHFFCLSAIRVYYTNRDNDPEALEKAIYYCKEQIKLAPKAKKQFLKESSSKTLPVHTGYKQLAIIYEKQKRYAEALSISEEAFSEGWNYEDCSKRIEKLKAKLQK